MLSRTLSIVPVARRALLLKSPTVSAVANRFDHHGPPANYRYPTMDDMLVPCGSWQEDYDNKQRKYNLHLLFGAGFFLISVVVGKYAGAFEFYFSPPEKPLDRASMGLTCD